MPGVEPLSYLLNDYIISISIHGVCEAITSGIVSKIQVEISQKQYQATKLRANNHRSSKSFNHVFRSKSHRFHFGFENFAYPQLYKIIIDKYISL